MVDFYLLTTDLYINRGSTVLYYVAYPLRDMPTHFLNQANKLPFSLLLVSPCSRVHLTRNTGHVFGSPSNMEN